MHQASPSLNNLRSAVLYEVFPRNHGRHGSFSDIVDDLERIRSLGTDILWLMPFYPIGQLNRKGTLGSPYAISDHRSIDQAIGNLADFKTLVKAVHAAGMKLLIDIVFNHTACDSKLMEEHPDWFLRDSSAGFTTKEPDWSDVYDLDYDNPGLCQYQIETLKFWKQQGLDGFRCDAAALLPMAFWRAAREAVDPEREMIWLAESVHLSFVQNLRAKGYACSSDTELHHIFDLTYDYDGFGYLEPALNKSLPLAAYLNHLFVQQTLYPHGSCKLRFLENHDVQRIAARVTNRHELKNWSAFYALLPGTTLVYAGQEYAMKRLPSLFEEDNIQWGAGDDSFCPYFGKLLKIGKQVKRLSGNFSCVELSPGLVCSKWVWNNGEFTGLFNLGSDQSILPLSTRLAGTDLMSNQYFRLEGSVKTSQLPLLLSTTEM